MRARLAPILLLVLSLTAPTALARQAQPAPDVYKLAQQALKTRGPGDAVVIKGFMFTNLADGKGIDVKATGDKTNVDLKQTNPPNAHLGNGTGSNGGSGDLSASAIDIGSSAIWRWVIGAVGVGLVGFGVYEFVKKPLPDIREGSIAAGAGLVLVVGAAFFPTLLVFFLFGAFVLVIGKNLLSATTKAKIEADAADVSKTVTTLVKSVSDPALPADVATAMKARIKAHMNDDPTQVAVVDAAKRTAAT